MDEATNLLCKYNNFNQVIREKVVILEVGYPEESEMLRSAMAGSTVQVFEK